MERCDLDAYQLAKTIVEALEEKKAEDILLLDLREVAPFTDYFVICSGTSDRMLRALVDAVMKKVRQVYRFNRKLEGMPSDGWIVADFGDVVLHLFSPDQRNYYRLEELWSEGKVLLHVQ